MYDVGFLVIGDGRGDKLAETVASARQNLNYPFTEMIMINDSGDLNYHDYLRAEYPEFSVLSHEIRRGLAQAIRTGWSALWCVDFIFHLEEDFTFNQPIDIQFMIDILLENPHLVSLNLKRDDVNPHEAEAGGWMHSVDWDFVQKDVFIEHDRLFSLNPCLYPISTAQIGWPEQGGETEFTNKVHELIPDAKFSILGALDDPPLVSHIGSYRSEGWKV